MARGTIIDSKWWAVFPGGHPLEHQAFTSQEDAVAYWPPEMRFWTETKVVYQVLFGTSGWRHTEPEEYKNPVPYEEWVAQKEARAAAKPKRKPKERDPREVEFERRMLEIQAASAKKKKQRREFAARRRQSA